jgi:DNA polymerase-3 subunit gamma/tau
MRDALSSLDQLISFRGDKVTEEDALGVFGLVSRSAIETLSGAILKGDTATILESIEKFDSAGKNMRRLVGELIQHFRNLVVVKALGPNSKSLEATGEQIKTLVAQAEGVDPGRIFRVCDQLAEMEDKLRYVLSVRTLIEMSLIRASRIASTATIEELMKAVRQLREGGEADVSVISPPAGVEATARTAPPTAAAPVSQEPPSVKAPPAPVPPKEEVKRDISSRRDILDDVNLNKILEAIPGSTVVDIR